MKPAILQKWRQALPQWINTQYEKLDKGGLPTKATVENILGKEGEIAFHALEES